MVFSQIPFDVSAQTRLGSHTLSHTVDDIWCRVWRQAGPSDSLTLLFISFIHPFIASLSLHTQYKLTRLALAKGKRNSGCQRKAPAVCKFKRKETVVRYLLSRTVYPVDPSQKCQRPPFGYTPHSLPPTPHPVCHTPSTRIINQTPKW